VNKRWRNVGLYVLAVITVIFIGTSVFDKPSTENATKTLRYSDFIEAVQDKEISRVLISPDNATAQVVENDGSRSEVNLAPDKDLLKILTENNVDIAVTPTKLANPWQQALSSLIFPVLLIGGLFFLFRRSQSGNAGGGNPAMSFGKSKARLQMEPSTQVTFSDVAGVEGAKLELTEVVDFLNLTHLANERAGNLSGGQKKLLELGRTMMVDAKLVLLDEVGAGVNRTLLKDLGTAILKLNKEKNYTFCMIEHDMDFISRMCDPVIVMADGSVLFEGTSEEVKKNEKVIESYLGKSNLTKKEN